MIIAGILLSTLLGTLIASILSCLPALHIYNVAGLIILIRLSMENSIFIPPEMMYAFTMSLVVAYSILNTIPSIFLSAPDESAIFVTLPGNRYMMLGKGYEAVVLTGVGGLGGVIFLVLISPFIPMILPTINKLLIPHIHWVLGTILAYMVLSEWPKGGDRGENPWHRFFSAWKGLSAGLLTILLSSIFGCIVLFRPIVPPEMSFQNIMPAFVGLFAVPWVLQNIISPKTPPSQHVCKSVDVTPRLLLRGIGAGSLGGLFAAVYPLITGGMGGLLAGQATAQNDERSFIISQGTSKTVYYVGAFLLLFVPDVNVTRGGMSLMVSGLHRPDGMGSYYMIISVICFSGALSFGLLLFYSRLLVKVMAKCNYRLISLITLGMILNLVFYVCSWQGIFVMIVGTGIGMIPVYLHSRRMNCMAVLLVPIILDSGGYRPFIEKFLFGN